MLIILRQIYLWYPWHVSWHKILATVMTQSLKSVQLRNILVGILVDRWKRFSHFPCMVHKIWSTGNSSLMRTHLNSDTKGLLVTLSGYCIQQRHAPKTWHEVHAKIRLYWIPKYRTLRHICWVKDICYALCHFLLQW